MTDYFTTRCNVSGSKEDVAAFLASAFTQENGKREFDFKKIIPMPSLIFESTERSAMRGGLYGKGLTVLLLIALNGIEEAIDAHKYAPGTPRPRREDMKDFRDEVQRFLDDLDKDTGISRSPLSANAKKAIIEKFLPHIDYYEVDILFSLGGVAEILLGNRKPWLRARAEKDSRKALRLLLKEISKLPRVKELLDEGAFNIRVAIETGYISWHDWRPANWGSTSNAWETQIKFLSHSEIDFVFQTNPSFPRPIFKKLGKMFPRMKIWCAFIDEKCQTSGWGHFTDVRDGEAGEWFDYIDDIDAAHFLVHDEKRLVSI
jgi:hypothetical protein